MADYGFIVPPRSRKELREIASQVRKVFGVKTPMLDIVRLVELTLPRADDGFVLIVEEESEMGDIHGLSNPVQKWIKLRRDVYEGAHAGKGRDRMTIAHELGHYLLHRQLDFPLVPPGGSVPAFRQSEWQATAFAAELLIGAEHYDKTITLHEIAKRFGVSYEAAHVQLSVINMEGASRK